MNLTFPFRPTIIAIFTLMFFLIGMSGCTVRLQPLPDSIEAELTQALDLGLDGLIVCVNQAGESRQYAAGWKNRESQVPADPHSLFKIASISKLYMAAAATKLVAEERLSLDQTLDELIPELVGGLEKTGEITVRMLLQHRSGLPEFIRRSDFPWDDLPIENEAVLDLIEGEPADFAPDKRRKYCNTNYLLLGEIMDQTLGYSHHQYIKEELLLPLGLTNTYGLLSDVAAEEVMSGYFVGYEPDVKLNDYLQPGGSMVATAEEVSSFVRALMDGSLLSSEEQDLYTSLYKYEHTGLLPGYQSIARYEEEIDAVVVLFVSTSGKNSWSKAESVYRRVVRILEKES